MKKWADEKRRPWSSRKGDKVMVNTPSVQSVSQSAQGASTTGAFPKEGRQGVLPTSATCLAEDSCLKPYHAHMEDPARGVSRRAPATGCTFFFISNKNLFYDR